MRGTTVKTKADRQRDTRRRRRPAARRGFTLVELIVAGLIASLVIGAVATALAQLGDAKRISRQRHAAFLRADAALETMRRDVVSVIRSDDLFYTRLLVYSGTGSGFDRDEIVVFSTRLRAVRDIDNFNGEGVEYETQYRIEEDELGPVLWQRRDAVPEEHPLGGGIVAPMVEGAVGLRLEVYDGHDWYDEWDSDDHGLPFAVAITVTASGHRDGDDPYDAPLATLRTIVSIDRVLEPRDVYEAEEQELRDLEAEEAGLDPESVEALGEAGGSGATTVINADGIEIPGNVVIDRDGNVTGGTIDSSGRVIPTGGGGGRSGSNSGGPGGGGGRTTGGGSGRTGNRGGPGVSDN